MTEPMKQPNRSFFRLTVLIHHVREDMIVFIAVGMESGGASLLGESESRTLD